MTKMKGFIIKCTVKSAPVLTIDDQSQPISNKKKFTFNLIIGIVCLLKEFHQKQNNEKKIGSPLHLSLCCWKLEKTKSTNLTRQESFSH